MKHATVLAATALLYIATQPLQPAWAGIKCQGTDQITRHGPIRTPYCEDDYLARLAGYSPRAVRQDPRIKQKACGRVGNDPSLSRTCFGIVPSMLVPGT